MKKLTLLFTIAIGFSPIAHSFKLKVHKSPEFVTTPQTISLESAAETAKKIKTFETVSVPPIVQPLLEIPLPILAQPESVVKNLIEIKPDEYKLIQALIFLEYQKKYDLAMSLFVELMAHPQYNDLATYHYAETAFSQKLYSEFRHKMIGVVKTAKDAVLKKMALEYLIKQINYLEVTDIALIDPLIKEYNLDVFSSPDYLLKKAKHFSALGNLGEFENALLLIPVDSKQHHEGTLLKAILSYRRGELDNALQTLEILWPTVKEDKKNEVRNLTALTLARLYFQKSDYSQAFKYYQSVDKSSGQWLQSMVEQAWTQVLAGDYEGAAGNMFSMHTDFFKKAYAPDTYIVRTVGYLNLCQYGDGLSILDDLNKKYKSIHEKLEAFKTANKADLQYYDLVKNFLKNSQQDEYSGVPRAFIVELARHPRYLKIQNQINNYEDENSRFNKITIDLIKKERVARLTMLKAKNELAGGKRDKKSKSTLADLEKSFLAKGIEHLITQRAREGIKKMREAAITRLTTEETQLRLKAAVNLKNRYFEFTASLDNLIDQKEVLSYEIYSGAGEHLRFQMAGGQVNADDKTRETAALKSSENQNYQWKHKGEVWEDEIGHYRSSLKNVCPKEEVAQINN